MHKAKRKLLSQNFFWNRELVGKLIRGSSISKDDVVLEIGSGNGVITEQLIAVSKKVIALEIDQEFFTSLKRKFVSAKNLNLINDDVLKYQFPTLGAYKIFSNIPFSITGEIVKRIMLGNNPPVDTYLVVQREAADKFVTHESGNSMLAILLFPWLEARVVHHFQRYDFRPVPTVDSCLLRFVWRPGPLVAHNLLPLYRDFISYHFGRNRLATSLSPQQWLKIFYEAIESKNTRETRKTKGAFEKWRREERKLSKIHRTRSKNKPLVKRG